MKKLLHLIDAQPSQDGDGVNIHRLAGAALHKLFDPYLMIDEIHSDSAADYIGGFPEHPHRGFETISYIKAGRMRHRDHMGNEGVINSGGVQWMSAGRGVLHSEMPEQEQGLLHGFQIWLNLPAAEKMNAPDYQDLSEEHITTVNLQRGGEVRVISGKLQIHSEDQKPSLSGPLPERSTQPLMADIMLARHSSVELTLETAGTVLVYVYQGAAQLPTQQEPEPSNTKTLEPQQVGLFEGNGTLQLTAGEQGLSALILSGKPINEPVVQYGPFVMNSEAEIAQAFADLRSNRLVDTQ